MDNTQHDKPHPTHTPAKELQDLDAAAHVLVEELEDLVQECAPDLDRIREALRAEDVEKRSGVDWGHVNREHVLDHPAVRKFMTEHAGDLFDHIAFERSD